MQIKKLLSIAMALTLSFGAVQTMGNISDVSFAAESEDANYIEGKCTLYDKKNHTLTVFGEVDKAELTQYRSGNNAGWIVEKIEASSSTVLPEDCNDLFAHFHDAKYIDIQHVDSSKVTKMYAIFAYDYSATVIHCPAYTGNVTDMGDMFAACSNLKYVNVNLLDTSNVESMHDMFACCAKLEKLDLSNFDTSNVINMNGMFRDCSALKELEIGSFDTSNVLGMENMFKGCSALETIHLNHFDTSKVVWMGEMFKDCRNLKWLDIKNFKTTSVIEMNSMFYDCKKLKELDLSSFTLSSELKSMEYMFAGCDNLETIKVNENWTHDKVSNVMHTGGMFFGCVNLRGGYGTKYDPAYTGAQYARIDTPAFKGYLTGPSVGGTEIGDTNNDGRVDATDASNILSKYAEYSTSGKTPTSDELAVYDVNGDGKINSVDASCVLSYYTYTQTGGTDSFADYMND